MTTTLSASSAAFAMLFYNYVWSGYRSIDVLHFGNSLLAGLVAVTAGCDKLTAMGSLAVGVGGAVVYYNAQRLTLYLKIDDVRYGVRSEPPRWRLLHAAAPCRCALLHAAVPCRCALLHAAARSSMLLLHAAASCRCSLLLRASSGCACSACRLNVPV